jgi:lysine 2,3-aminomutase
MNQDYLSLIQHPGDLIWAKTVPDIRELDQTTGCEDPLNEELDSPVPGLIHRYPSRPPERD